MSLYVMKARITFPKRKGRKAVILHAIENVLINSSSKSLTDTAELTLPRKVLKKTFDKTRVREVFRRGDWMRIELGYYDAQDKRKGLRREFEGYVTEVSADMPIRMKCEDEMWKLKQIPVDYSGKNVSLKQLLKDILPKYTIDASEKEFLGAVRYTETTAAEVLKQLQYDKNIYSYFKSGKLISGKRYNTSRTHTFDLERNAVSERLQYRLAEDIKILIVAANMSKGKKTECKVGEAGGEVYRLNYTSPELIALEDLKQKAQADYDNRKADGLEGSFTAFGKPSVQHSEKVKVKSRIYTDRQGVYYVESVNKRFNPSGYRQEIRLGRRV